MFSQVAESRYRSADPRNVNRLDHPHARRSAVVGGRGPGCCPVPTPGERPRWSPRCVSIAVDERGEGARPRVADDAVGVDVMPRGHTNAGVAELIGGQRVMKAHPSAWIFDDEVTSLTRAGARQGSTVIEALLSAWSGAPIGNATRTHGNTRIDGVD